MHSFKRKHMASEAGQTVSQVSGEEKQEQKPEVEFSFKQNYDCVSDQSEYKRPKCPKVAIRLV